jgi:DNA processing protein
VSRPDPDDWLALALARPDPLLWGRLQRGEADGPLPPRDRGALASLRRRAADCGARILTPADAAWPDRLRSLPDPPAALFLRGDPAHLARPQVAVVGARRASRGGLDDAAWIADDLARAGLAVTSGLALGIDGAAHGAALDAGGTTIAVLGHGPERTYPALHRALARRIAAEGALLTEFPPGTPPLAHHFPRRNRLIAGLALGVVVVEATERSGSMITARLAAAQGREVFVLPRRARDPGGAGGHRLLREGAVLVRNVDDVLEELALPGPATAAPGGPGADAPPHDPPVPGAGAPDDPVDAALLAALDEAGTPFEVLSVRTGLDAGELGARLTLLELDGRVARDGDRLVPRVPGAQAPARRL